MDPELKNVMEFSLIWQLEILYNGHPLAPEYKLSDVAYIFSWKEVRYESFFFFFFFFFD